ncbi:antibiotic biosynthesis monooxygenase family protein [Bacillus sp. REN16]|uniref:antibiotic biosynthesis monooxygenase family protein n=1 Tax=Bacillus sp. REN16 TaxID=2887296 RepID=UPI001E345DA8|nr:antibiotic biosynthesis monooxygenase [Bacillus sp. REN16]MCC3355475.1 antibiotic biosynthesis monooxygenase [Bacillus sp. REN16]
MNFYIAFGTIDFLEKLHEKYKKENMTAFYNNETAILLHETTKKSVFAAPRKYEVITGEGNLNDAAFAAFTYVPVTDEGKPLFEYNITQRNSLFQNTSGFIAFRALRPIKSDTFVIASFWLKESYYLDWTRSQAFEQLEQVIEKTKAGLSQTVFTGPVYTKTFHSSKTN